MALDSELPILVTLARLKDAQLTDRDRLLDRLRSPDSKKLAAMLLEGVEAAETDELTAKLKAVRELAGVK